MATLLSGSGTNGLAAGSGGANLLPRSVSSDIWKKALANSIVPNLSANHPMILGENTFPILTKRPSASIVGEGAQKPHSTLEVGSKSVRPIKAVVGLEFTMEAVMVIPAGVLDLISEEMSGALSRQVDLAVLHKRDATTGATLSAGVEALSDTTNVVDLTPTTMPAGGVEQLLWDGYGQIVNGDFDFTGFAWDPRLAYSLATARDSEGRRLHPEIGMGTSGTVVTSFEGQALVTSKIVSGQADGSTDTGIRAFGGDWNALKFGYVLDIGLKKIEYGDPFGNGDLQGRNCVAYMAEVIFGWGIIDLDAFVKYAEVA